MDVSEIRRTNVSALVAEAGGPTEFGKRIDRDQAQVSQWLSATNPKPIGGRLARYIETRIGREAGWLDRPQWQSARSELRPDQQAILDLWEALDTDGRRAVQTVGHALTKPVTRKKTG